MGNSIRSFFLRDTLTHGAVVLHVHCCAASGVVGPGAPTSSKAAGAGAGTGAGVGTSVVGAASAPRKRPTVKTIEALDDADGPSDVPGYLKGRQVLLRSSVLIMWYHSHSRLPPSLPPYTPSISLSLCTNMTLTLLISLFPSTVLSLPRRDSLLRCLSCLSCALPSLVCAGPPSCALSPCPAFSQVIDGDLESYLETTPFES